MGLLAGNLAAPTFPRRNLVLSLLAVATALGVAAPVAEAGFILHRPLAVVPPPARFASPVARLSAPPPAPTAPSFVPKGVPHPLSAGATLAPGVHTQDADTCPCEVLPPGGVCLADVGRGFCRMHTCDSRWVCTAPRAGAAMCRKRRLQTALTCTVALRGRAPGTGVCPCGWLDKPREMVEPLDVEWV